MQPPAIIAGLGNPGAEYAATRHNVGFRVLECLAGRWGGVWEALPKFRADVVRSRRSGRTVWLCRPRTYMNLSGEAVGPLARYYQVPVEQVMVVVDDADLPLGTVRMRGEGGNGGHHGLESVEQALGARGYGRQRIGIGRALLGRGDMVGHVLGRFTPEEQGWMVRVMQRAADQLECWLAEGVVTAMNRFNGSELDAKT
jgi:peptidyl-tRNA hydrolase, PTH1 family